MPVVLALAAAAAWGASDFLGGLAGRRSDGDATLAVTFQAQLLGGAILIVASAVVGGTVTGGDVVAGIVAGVGAGVAVVSLYRGLHVGRMGVVAPITGAVGAAVPVIVGTLRGEEPTTLAWVGITTALVAIVLVSREPAPDDPSTGTRIPPGLGHGIIAGLGFALAFVALDGTTAGSGLWPTVATKFASGAVAWVLAVATGARLTTTPATRRAPFAIGALDVVAYPAYLLASRGGLLGLVAVLSSLYPVVTVLLARSVLGEHLVRHQVVGLVLALTAVVFIAAG